MSEDFLRRMLALRILSDGPGTFEEIVRRSFGIYPTDLRDLLDSLVESSSLQILNGHYIHPGFAAQGWEQGEQRPELALIEPHPHDCDWRFDRTTAVTLADSISSMAPRGGKIVLLGAPRLFSEFARRPINGDVYLVDSNRALTRHLRNQAMPFGCHVIEHDLVSSGLIEFPQHVDIVMCDPPWYIPYYEAFIAQASALAKFGGLVLVSLLPIGTRPGAWSDRNSILSFSSRVGFHINSLVPAYLRYETPGFERRSLASQGLVVPEDWRSGDLLTLQKTHDAEPPVLKKALEMAQERAIEKSEWLEETVGLRKIKLRLPLDSEDAEPDLTSIEPEDLLPTVSRRYLGREHVDLWLWDNRVFGARGKSALWAAICQLAGREAIETRVSGALVTKARDLISNLISDGEGMVP